MEMGILKPAAPTSPRTPLPARLIHRLVRELAEDADLRVEVAVAGRVLRVPRSGYDEWRRRPTLWPRSR
jgi:hypothetical protein